MLVRIFRAVRTPFTLLLLLGVLCYGAWWGWTNVIRPVPAAVPAPCVEQTLPQGQLKSSQVSVRVYNGGQKNGLAGDVGRALRERGFKVGEIGDTGERVGKTTIVGASDKNPEVQLVKGFFRNAEVRADKRVDGSVDVFVGNQYGGFNRKAKTSFTVKSKKVCLPAQPTARPTVGS